MNTERVISDAPRSLKEWRDVEEIDQEQAAKRLRISQSYYSKLERGKRRPSGKILKRLHEKTHVPLPVLLGSLVR